MGGIKSNVDLHMHSSASDGRDRADELLAKVEAAGIECFALTDHDTIAGVLDMGRHNSGKPSDGFGGRNLGCYHPLGGSDPFD